MHLFAFSKLPLTGRQICIATSLRTANVRLRDQQRYLSGLWTMGVHGCATNNRSIIVPR